MPARTRSEKKIAVGFKLSPEVDRAVEHLKVDTGFEKSELAELALRILLAIARVKRIPDDLGEVLSQVDPEALEMLNELIHKLGGG